jgi:pentatricopeptide repeat-containing protein PET309
VPSTIPSSRLVRRHAAAAQAVEEETETYDNTPLLSSFQSDPDNGDRPKSGIPRRHEFVSPPWSYLPEAFNKSLLSGEITSPTDFRSTFELHKCQSGQLAQISTLEAIFVIYLTSAEPSQWAWLSGQLQHMVAAVDDAGPSAFRNDTPDLGNVMRAYCLAQLGQTTEARNALNLLRNRSERAVVHAIKGLVLLELNEPDGAQDEMSKAIRRGVTRSGAWMSKACLRAISLYLRQANQENAIGVMQKGGDQFLKLFYDKTRRNNVPKLTQMWSKWLSKVPASISTADSSYQGLRVQRIHFGLIAGDADRSREALELFINMKHQDAIRHNVLRNLMIKDVIALFRHLVAIDQIQAAMFVFNTIRENRPLVHDNLTACLFHLSESEVDVTHEMEQIWELINTIAEPSPVDRRSIARLYAGRGDLEATQAVYADWVAPAARADYQKNRYLLLAAVTGSHATEAIQYLKPVLHYKPDLIPFNQVLEMLIWIKQDEAALDLYGSISDYLPSDTTPDNRTYTSIISIYGRRRDPQGAEDTLQAMLAADVQPDAATWSALLNAYVESGDWSGVAGRWETIPEQYKKADSVIATGMKAMVLQSFPFSRVLSIFRSVEKPSTRHWALVLQSASESQNIEAMEALFQEMRSISQESPEAAKPNVYTWSIILHAYLRVNDVKKSQTIYDEMLAAGIVPTSITYSMIISSYAADGRSGTLQRAQEFAMSIYRLANLPDGQLRLASERGARGQVHENLLSPLVIAAGQAGQPELAGEYFDLVAEKETPSLPLYTQYLDAWRKAGDLHMVKAIWAELFALACRTVASQSSLSTRKTTTRTPENALCIPLSIVLITLGKEKRLLDIKETWNACRTAGFGFDSANFNHLAVSLAQSGDVEGAFDVVENVLIETEATEIDETPPPIPDATEPSFRPPNRRIENISNDSYHPDPGAEPLNALVSTTANDALWGPHFKTIAALDTLISQLETSESNRAWLGLMSEEAEAEEDSEGDGSPVELAQFDTCVRDSNTGQPKKTTAKGLLMKLNRKYSKAMALVMFHRRKQASLAQKKVTRKGQ